MLQLSMLHQAWNLTRWMQLSGVLKMAKGEKLIDTSHHFLTFSHPLPCTTAFSMSNAIHVYTNTKKIMAISIAPQHLNTLHFCSNIRMCTSHFSKHSASALFLLNERLCYGMSVWAIVSFFSRVNDSPPPVSYPKHLRVTQASSLLAKKGKYRRMQRTRSRLLQVPHARTP